MRYWRLTVQGLLLIDKPEGITSFGAVARVKKLCNTKRVGHTGTLDPMATGVLPVFVGRATVLSNYLLCADKEYIANVRLGITTDTLDITGEIQHICSVNLSEEQLLNATESFKGEIEQIPPMYSAIKKNGKKLYELAREGKEVQREARKVEIKELEIFDFDGESFNMRVLCSKGTYIRSLADDIGRSLGTGAVLTSLRRTKTAGFTEKDCTALDSITEDEVKKFLISEEKAVEHFPFVMVSKKQAVRFTNGGELDLNRLNNMSGANGGNIFRIKYNNEFLGLGRVDISSNSMKIECLVNVDFK